MACDPPEAQLERRRPGLIEEGPGPLGVARTSPAEKHPGPLQAGPRQPGGCSHPLVQGVGGGEMGLCLIEAAARTAASDAR